MSSCGVSCEQRSRARDAAKKQRRLEALELEAQCEEEHGERGVDWDMVDAGKGPFVVLKRGPAGIFRKWKLTLEKGKDQKNEEATLDFVTAQVVHPTRDEFKQLAGQFYGLWEDCAKKLRDMHSAKEDETAGKA